MQLKPSPRIVPALLAYWPAWLTAGLSLLIVLSLVNLREGQLQLLEHRQVEAELGVLRTKLEATVATTFNPTVGLAAMIQLDGDISAERFEALTRQVLRPVPHIRSVAVAPDDVVRHIFPFKGNEKVLNLAYRDVPVQNAQVQLARERQEPLIVAPVKLVQGGLAVIQRNPVFLPAPVGQIRPYWGVVSVVADLPRFVLAAGLTPHASLDVALFDTLVDGSLGAPIWGPVDIAVTGLGAPVVQLVQLPGARWALAARPQGGWQGLSNAWALPEVLGTLAAGLLLSLSAFLLSRGRLQLQRRNQQLSSEIEQSRRVLAELEQSQEALTLAESQLRELNAELETRVGLRTAELSAALSHLQQAQDELLRSEKMAALGSLVAGVAHELNTPLGNCLTTASTLEERTRETRKAFELDKLRRSSLADYLRDADTAAGILLRSLGTANELVAHFKQLSVDQTSTQRRSFELSRTLDDVLSLLRPRLRNTGYRIECDIQLDRPLDSYPGPLGQVVSNLVLNALAHAFEGRDSGVLRISARALDAERLQLTIEDDGAGMSEEVRRRAFDPFFTTKMGSGGTGLGLNIVYNIVSGILGGQIELTSVPGQGSRFVFRLPFVAPPLPRGAHAPLPAPPRRRF